MQNQFLTNSGDLWLTEFASSKKWHLPLFRHADAGPLTWIMSAARPLHFICDDNSSRDAPPESDGNLPFHIRSWRTCRSRWLQKHPLSLQSMRLARRLWAVPSSRIHQIGWHRDEIHNADNTLIALCRPPFRGSLRFRFQLMLHCSICSCQCVLLAAAT